VNIDEFVAKPSLGFVGLLAAVALTAAVGAAQRELVASLYGSPVVAAVFINCLVWWGALEIGRTRQFLASVLLLELVLASPLVLLCHKV
jgi:hypothetical protein